MLREDGLRFSGSVCVPPECQRQYEDVFLIRNLFQDPALFKDSLERMERDLAQHLPSLGGAKVETDVCSAEDLAPEDIAALFRDAMRPIVVRGFAKDHRSVREWTPAYFRERYGHMPIWYSSAEKLVISDGTTLREGIDMTLGSTNSRAYVENLSDIFNEFPELHDQLELDRVARYLEGSAEYHRIAQLFIGGPGTGASFHCANELNCFFQIHGRKRWTFVHPKYALAMYSTLFNKGIFVGSLVKHNAPSRYIEARQPLYNRIPRLEIVLEPGDLLINPPWWWHAINNLGDATIAVATRWRFTTDYQRQNPLYDFVQSFREERLTLEGKEMADSDVVVPDRELRHKYVSYEEMGWRDDNS